MTPWRQNGLCSRALRAARGTARGGLPGRPGPSRSEGRPRRRRRAAVVALALALVAVPVEALALQTSFGPVADNPADKLVNRPIDAYEYDYATRCDTRPDPGMRSLQSWLDRNAGGSSWGIMRCSRLTRGYSLHAEGRAIDWRLNVHRTSERREATRLMRLLLATDKRGNRHALARRMGIQEIIWNCEAWWSGNRGLVRYSRCYDSNGRRKRVDDTNAHRDHMHIGMNRRGGRRKTTFWARGPAAAHSHSARDRAGKMLSAPGH